MAALLILGIIVVLGVLTVASLLFTGVIKIGKKKNNNATAAGGNKYSHDPTKKDCGPDGTNTIAPKPFKTGFVQKSPQPTANVCSRDDKFRYAINLPFADYGLPEISDDCLCVEFVQAP